MNSDNPIVRDSIGNNRDSIISIDIRSTITNKDISHIDTSKVYNNTNNNTKNTYISQRNSLSDHSDVSNASILKHLLLLVTLNDKYFDIKTYKLFIKFSIILMSINVLIYIGINIAIRVFSETNDLDLIDLDIVRVQLSFFIIGACFEIFCIYRSVLLFYKFTEKNAIYVLITSVAYILILIGEIADGACLYSTNEIKDNLNSKILIFFIILSIFLFMWQIYTSYVCYKLFQYIKFNYDGDGDSTSRNSSYGNGRKSLSIPLRSSL